MFRTTVVLAFSVSATTCLQAARGYGDIPSFGVSGNGCGKATNREDIICGGGDVGFASVRDLLEVTRDLDQSMSMSFHYPKPTPRPSVAHTMTPSQVPISASSSSPTSSFSLTNSPTGTGEPSGSASPSKPPSHSPSGSSAPSFRPSLSSIGVFECTDQGVVRVDKAGDKTTPIHLTIAYEAEVNRTTYSVQALAELELALLEAAIAGALDCASPHRERRVLEDQGRILLTSTDKLGVCNTTFANADCFVLQTDLAFILNKAINSDYVSYLAYSALEEGMTNDKFVDEIDEFFRLTYLAPFPIIPPATSSQPLGSVEDEPVFEKKGNNRSHGWIIGVCVAMVTGSLVALGAWFYKRNIYDKRSVEVTEAVLESPESDFSGERELIEC